MVAISNTDSRTRLQINSTIYPMDSTMKLMFRNWLHYQLVDCLSVYGIEVVKIMSLFVLFIKNAINYAR